MAKTKKNKQLDENIGFTDKEWTTCSFRARFLYDTQELAPEVLNSLKNLVPQYKEVTNGRPLNGSLVRFLSGESSWDLGSEEDRRWFLDHNLDVKGRYGITDAVELPKAENRALKKAIELRENYEIFLQRFGLTSAWLREGLFRLLRDLSHSPEYYSHLGLCEAYIHCYFVRSGPVIEIQIDGWKIDEEWQRFRARAMEKFEATLMEYKDQISRYFSQNGYKRKTKPYDLSVVKWLVLWTVKQVPKETILAEIAKTRPSKMTIEDLNREFRRLEVDYDLPYRRLKRGKSPPQKRAEKNP